MDRLETYRRKRDFSRSPEPSGEGRSGKGRKGLRYLIQKHDATREHYDFRLEHDGVLLSWACPKGPSLDPADKRLAVHVEDHPLDYGSFEGTIPKGQYGGGTVMLWDTGTWEPDGDVASGFAKGKIAFTLYGERLHGKWALIRLRSRGKQDRGRDNWLLIKERDDEVREGGTPITETETTSVETGRTMDEIAKGGEVWRSGGKAERKTEDAGRKAAPRKAKASKKTERSKKAETSKETKAPKKAKAPKQAKAGRKTGAVKLPAFVSPQLATLVDHAPEGDDWLHEVKFDGYRALASIGNGTVIIRTRKGLDWTDRFASLVAPLSTLPCRSALLDGEIAVSDDAGRTDFGALQNALSAHRGGFGYYIFDLLHLDGRDLRERPLIERKTMLAKLLGAVPKNGPLFYSDHVQGHGDRVFKEACSLKLEGIIAKRASDPYRSGRESSWLKIKCGMEQEFVIIGWRKSPKRGRPFSSILLGVYDKGALRYCGRVGSGFDDSQLDELAALFRKHARKTAPVPNVPASIKRDAHFLEPVLVAEISLRGWTRDGMVRQGSFKGWRQDKSARDVVRETPKHVVAAKAGAERRTTRGRAMDDNDTLGTVRFTHPDRVVFPGDDVTKRDVADHYIAVAERLTPHLVRRPISFLRCPDGVGKECFFQKHATKGWPEQLKPIKIREKSGVKQYLYIEDITGVVAAVQMGVIEFHVWQCSVDDVEKPNRLVFDFDPDEDLPFAAVKSAAKEMKDRLDDLGLTSFPMLTGGKGVHVVVPLRPGHSWDEHRDFAEAMARLMADDSPDKYLATMSKAKRKDRIFIDYLRNGRGSTAIAPLSVRARAGAPVAWPVSWQQLSRATSAHPVTVATAAKKLPKADPWSDFFDVKQSLPSMKRR